jgi:septum formation inhibitor-activating ATPase MinD
MSGYVCPSCGVGADVLCSGAGEELAEELGVRFLGRVPLDQSVAEGSDAGKPFVLSVPESEAAKVFQTVTDNFELSVRELEASADQQIKDYVAPAVSRA